MITKHKTFFIQLFVLALLFSSFSMAHAAGLKLCPAMTPEDLLNASKKYSYQAQLTGDDRQKSQLALDGVACAEACLAKEPNNVGCLYYRAVNLGLELDTHFVPSKADLQKMVGDFKRVLELDGSYDKGGAYQALGYVYLLVPPLPVLGADLQRDLDKAANYARQAINIAPKEPENLKLAGDIFLKRKNYTEAAKYFTDALKFSEMITNPDVIQLRTRQEIKKQLQKSQK